jgi:hypothetical protein
MSLFASPDFGAGGLAGLLDYLLNCSGVCVFLVCIAVALGWRPWQHRSDGPNDEGKDRKQAAWHLTFPGGARER